MSKLEETKEYISTLRTYIAIVGAMLLALGAGLSKLLDEEKIGALFWFGLILGSVFLFYSFCLLGQHTGILKNWRICNMTFATIALGLFALGLAVVMPYWVYTVVKE